MADKEDDHEFDQDFEDQDDNDEQENDEQDVSK